MINFSNLNRHSILGKLFRLPLKFIPNGITMPIIQGYLKGYKWMHYKGTNGSWLGTYELKQQNLFHQYINNEDTVFDLGANKGFFSLLASKFVGPNGKVFAVEPIRTNQDYIKKNILIDDLHNIKCLNIAVSNIDKDIYFDEGQCNSSGHISEKGNLKVQCRSLDGLLFDKIFTEVNFIKIDVEGEELNVLKGARNVIAIFKPKILVGTHSKELHDDCLNFLRKLKYNVEEIEYFNSNEYDGSIISWVIEGKSEKKSIGDKLDKFLSKKSK